MPLENPSSRPEQAFALNRQQTWQDLLARAEQIFALCSEQTEPLFFEDTQLEDCQIVFKPHRMHSVESGQKSQKKSRRNMEPQAKQTSMELAIKQFYARPDQLSGADSLPPASEGGLVQRLDYETAGLLLRAPDQERQQYLRELQKAHKIKKFYLAWSPFAPASQFTSLPAKQPAKHFAELTNPQVLNSYFCSYGPKGGQVRILTTDEMAKQKGKKRKVLLCQTKIEAWRPCCDEQKGCIFLVSLHQGFRHQVRAQLAHLSFPLCCEPLYSASSSALPWHPKQPPDSSNAPQPYPRLGLIACGFELCGQRVSISIT